MGILSLINRRKQTVDDRETYLESIVGKKCVVIEKIDNFVGSGLVKVNGQCWAARSAYDDDCFDAGESLSVVAIEGVKLVCLKR